LRGVRTQLLAIEPMCAQPTTGALAVRSPVLRAADLPKLIRFEEILAGTIHFITAPGKRRRPVRRTESRTGTSSPAPSSAETRRPRAAKKHSSGRALHRSRISLIPASGTRGPSLPLLRRLHRRRFPRRSPGRLASRLTAVHGRLSPRAPNLAGFLDALTRSLRDVGHAPGSWRDAYLAPALDGPIGLFWKSGKVIWGREPPGDPGEPGGRRRRRRGGEASRAHEVDPSVQASLRSSRAAGLSRRKHAYNGGVSDIAACSEVEEQPKLDASSASSPNFFEASVGGGHGHCY